MTDENPLHDAVTAHLRSHYRPDAAADLLAAAQPLMAIAWDEGNVVGQLDPFFTPNPYRKEKP